MILGDLGQTLGCKMPILVALALLLISSSAVGHVQHPPHYLTRYEPTGHNYSRSTISGNILHVSHSLPGRSSISITSHSLPGRSSMSITRGSSVRPRLGPHTLGSRLTPSKNVVPLQRTPLVTSNELRPDENNIPGPFSPRFQVGRWEAGDEEWKAEIKKGLQGSGLVPDHLPSYPNGLVNINFGMHGCIHLGTQLQAQTVAHPPTRFSYPAETDRLYTVLLVDVDTLFLHWLVINIPGTSLADGQVIAEYQPPTPSSHYPHRYLAVALLQDGVTDRQSVKDRSAYLCQEENRQQFYLKQFLSKHRMEVSAANYFLVSHEPYVEAINQFCRDRRRAVNNYV